jgi:hypothetical protein
VRTLPLRAARCARVAVVAAEWCDAFGVVTRGRVQELRDGEPVPVLGRGAGLQVPRHRRPRPAEPRPSHGDGAHRHVQGHDRHLPVNTTPYISY